MKIKISLLASAAFFVLSYSATSCRKDKIAQQLTLENQTDTIAAEGETKTLSFTSDASWSIGVGSSDWLQFSQTSGNSGNASIQLTAPANTSGITRSVLLQINSADGQSRRITVLQAPVIFASYNTSPIAPDATGMGSTAMQINANIKMGYNLWNTMEAPGGETGWGNPVITQSLIDTLKEAGFNAIRIPCGYWYSHANHTTGEIDADWLNRVREVVQYCFNDGMYVLLNDHWDGGWLDCKATGAKLDTVKAIQKAIWEQVATKLRDFDEHLMFASSNEPDATDLSSSTNLYAYHQIFINAVRSTGGKNAYRTLVIQAPSTSLDLANYFAPGALPGMPYDAVPDKLMLEFHYYTPPNFCILSDDASWGKEWRYWGANLKSLTDPEHNSNPDTEEAYMESNMQWAKKSFVDKNIPVLIGEFGASYHADDLAGNPADSILSLTSVAHFFGHTVRTARANGLSAFLWAGVINRQTETIDSRQQLDSLRAGAGF